MTPVQVFQELEVCISLMTACEKYTRMTCTVYVERLKRPQEDIIVHSQITSKKNAPVLNHSLGLQSHDLGCTRLLWDCKNGLYWYKYVWTWYGVGRVNSTNQWGLEDVLLKKELQVWDPKLWPYLQNQIELEIVVSRQLLLEETLSSSLGWRHFR